MLYPKAFDVIVLGAGHAGCEAALACARLGFETLLLTLNLDTIAQMSCNPAIGGIAKGHLVREIDALGGQMAKTIDATGIHFKMLNTSKGPAVQAGRAQADKKAYQFSMKHTLESQNHLTLKQDAAETLVCEQNKVRGVLGRSGYLYPTQACILTTGTFMQGLIHIGENQMGGGRLAEPAVTGISKSLRDWGFQLERFKTGTPPRLNGRTLDFSPCSIQLPDPDPVPFSYSTSRITQDQVSCYLTHTTPETHEIIQKNLHRAPLYTGQIQSCGPRYCPSLETKIVRFAGKSSHQVFLEPEGRNTLEFYCNGLSTSLPVDVQEAVIHSIPGLEKADIVRYGYAIEYDYLPPTQLKLSLETKRMENLFLAGQINGTSGYEEAAAQGLMAGLNAARKLQGRESLILKRHEAYIGVMLEDLVTRGVSEPYRLFTSRAEHRLLLRYDNADLRLRSYGYEAGLVDSATYQTFQQKRKLMETIQTICQQTYCSGRSLAQILCSNGSSLETLWHREDVARPLQKKLFQHFPELQTLDRDILQRAEIELRYQGYIEREFKTVERNQRLENKRIPEGLDYFRVPHLRHEAKEKLSALRPEYVGQASRISGMTPADIHVLMIHLGI